MRALNIFFIVLFLLSAVLQYNDPDPYLWIPIYLLGAYICWHAIKGIFIPWLYTGALVLYGTYAILLLLQPEGVVSWWQDHDAENIAQSMKAEKPWIESTREFFGLLILIVAVAVNMLHLKRLKDSPQN